MYGQNYPGQGDVISTPGSKLVRAPERPFPWWGPFDAVNAVGRAVLLFGLLGMATYFLRLLLLRESPGMMDPRMMAGRGIAQGETTLTTVLNIVNTVLYILAGVGILLRKKWGVWIIRILLAWITLGLLYGIYKIVSEVPWSFPGSGKIFLMLLPVILASLVLICTFIIAMWTYWSKPSTRYEFQHVNVSELQYGMHESTILFGIAAALTGIAIGLYALQVILAFVMLPFPGSMGIPGLICIVVIIAALLIAIGGFIYRARSNGGRIILRVMSFLAFALLVIAFVLVIIASGFSLDTIALSPAHDIARGGITLFSFIVFGYILIEIMRYLSSDKAKAWCGVGNYEPPWNAQIKLSEPHAEEPPDDGQPRMGAQLYRPPQGGN